MIDSQEHFQTLLDRLNSGDATAAEEFVREYEPLVRRAVRLGLHRSRLRRVFDSMDFCQSVFGDFFKRVVAGRNDVESVDHLTHLLVLITRNKLAFALRKEYRKLRLQENHLVKGVARDAIDPEPTPSQHATARELAELIRQQLTPDQRRLAEMRANGKSWEEISKTVGGTAHACRVRLTRSIHRILEELGMNGYAT